MEFDDSAVDRGCDGSQIRQHYFGRRDGGEAGECRVVRDRLREHRPMGKSASSSEAHRRAVRRHHRQREQLLVLRVVVLVPGPRDRYVFPVRPAHLPTAERIASWPDFSTEQRPRRRCGSSVFR